ncbi:MAG: hypothetical protein IPF50_06260 [Proteobacteria bacterium]|nr:hypothetical protein [Pseudomonadota bacterium]
MLDVAADQRCTQRGVVEVTALSVGARADRHSRRGVVGCQVGHRSAHRCKGVAVGVVDCAGLDPRHGCVEPFALCVEPHRPRGKVPAAKRLRTAGFDEADGAHGIEVVEEGCFRRRNGYLRRGIRRRRR